MDRTLKNRFGGLEKRGHSNQREQLEQRYGTRKSPSINHDLRMGRSPVCLEYKDI